MLRAPLPHVLTVKRCFLCFAELPALFLPLPQGADFGVASLSPPAVKPRKSQLAAILLDEKECLSLLQSKQSVHAEESSAVVRQYAQGFIYIIL